LPTKTEKLLVIYSLTGQWEEQNEKKSDGPIKFLRKPAENFTLQAKNGGTLKGNLTTHL